MLDISNVIPNWIFFFLFREKGLMENKKACMCQRILSLDLSSFSFSISYISEEAQMFGMYWFHKLSK